jgi:hypothetical protein
MADERKGVVAAGFALMWRRQGVLWWVFVVNLVCGVFGAIPVIVTLSHALGNSLAGQKLTRGFDLGMYDELLRLPEVNLMRTMGAVYVFAFLFMLFMLFVSGGILESYKQDRKLTTGEFFAASGAFFWRFVRLALLSIVPFVIVWMSHQALSKWTDKVGDQAIADQVGIFLTGGTVIFLLLFSLWVRLWFDIAQVRAVVLNERGMWRNTWRAWRITWHDLRHIYRVYFCISLVAWVTLALGVVTWAHLPPTATPLTFLVLELVVFAQLLTRLWQLSSAMTWYQRHPDAIAVGVVEVVEFTPLPPETIEPEPLPPGDPGPELPPADA